MMGKRKKTEKTEEPSQVFTPVVQEIKQPTATKETVCKLISEAPEAKVVPTQRWYGETFYPAYTEWLAKLKAACKQ